MAKRPSQSTPAVVEGDEPVIDNGHAVGIAAEIAEDVLRPAERRLCVAGPVEPVQAIEESLPGSRPVPRRSAPLQFALRRIYKLRSDAGLTRKELATLVGTWGLAALTATDCMTKKRKKLIMKPWLPDSPAAL